MGQNETGLCKWDKTRQNGVKWDRTRNIGVKVDRTRQCGVKWDRTRQHGVIYGDGQRLHGFIVPETEWCEMGHAVTDTCSLEHCCYVS